MKISEELLERAHYLEKDIVSWVKGWPRVKGEACAVWNGTAPSKVYIPHSYELAISEQAYSFISTHDENGIEDYNDTIASSKEEVVTKLKELAAKAKEEGL